MNSADSILVIYNARLVDSCLDSPGMIVVKNRKIRAVFLGEVSDAKSAVKIASSVLTQMEMKPEFFDAKGLVLMPSFIDMHAHFRYPGQTQKEDLDSGLAAACAGGFGTVVTMANTVPVVSTAKLAGEIMREADEKNIAKVIQAVSITKDFEGENTSEIEKLQSARFPVVSEDGRDVSSATVMLDGMRRAAKNNIIVSCHCEDSALSFTAKTYRLRALTFMKKYSIPAGDVKAVVGGVPDSVNFEIDGNISAANQILALAEDIATARNIEIAKLAGCHVHICHCSTANSMNSVRAAKKLIKSGKIANGFECTVEVTPHHLALAGTDSPLLRALVNPPLRSEEDREALIEAIKDGTVDVISTDHAPHTKEDKAAGAPGFPGLETAFAVCNTVLVQKEGLSLSDLSRLMSGNPAKILKLNAGRFSPGFDANLVLVDPDETWVCNAENFLSKGKSSPFDGKRLTGKVLATFFGGKQVYSAL